jgi:hypothetical protein
MKIVVFWDVTPYTLIGTKVPEESAASLIRVED